MTCPFTPPFVLEECYLHDNDQANQMFSIIDSKGRFVSAMMSKKKAEWLMGVLAGTPDAEEVRRTLDGIWAVFTAIKVYYGESEGLTKEEIAETQCEAGQELCTNLLKKLNEPNH